MNITRTTCTFIAVKFTSKSGYITMSGITRSIDELYKIPFVKEVLAAGCKYQKLIFNCGKEIEVEYLTEEELNEASAEEMYAEEVDALAVLITR